MSYVRVYRRHSRRHAIRQLLIEPLLSRLPLAADFQLVADLAPEDSLDNRVKEIANISGVVYFVQSDPVHGFELWRSAGTDASTQLVKDIMPGTDSAFIKYLTNVNGTLFFVAKDDKGIELWKSDGTEAGTVTVKDINPTGSASPHSLINANGLLYFEANDGVHGYELWKSDGTDAGTVMVRDINSGSADGRAVQMANIGSTVYFTANDGTTGQELWKSDGTLAGTVIVRDITPGAPPPTNVYNKAVVNGILYFSANDGQHGDELWRSNGTSPGTFMVDDSVFGSGGTKPTDLINVGGTLFFRGFTSSAGRELWKSNGTAAGTALVADIYSGNASSGIDNMTAIGNTVFFSANDNLNGYELWKSDGTGGGTNMVRDLTTTGAGSHPWNLVNVNGLLYFAANDGVSGYELWVSDGTSPGTVMVKNINLSSGSGPRYLTNVSGLLYFSAARDLHGGELWKTNGTLTSEVTTDHPTAAADPRLIASIDDKVLFFALDPLGDRKLWASNGTQAGTVLCTPSQGFNGYFDDIFVQRIGSILYFVGKDTAHGRELWRSDGTTAGTYIVRDIVAGPAGAGVEELTEVNGVLYFVANDGLTGNGLWRSNGTVSGTYLVADINPGLTGDVRNLTNFNGALIFSPYETNSGYELWRSDGTLFGTTLIKDILSGSDSSFPSQFLPIGNTLYFTASTAAGIEVWKTNGTAAGTVMVKDINPVASSFPEHLFNVNGTLYLIAEDGLTGRELWKSDGTAAGTVMVKDISVGAASTSFNSLVNLNGSLLFDAEDAVSGRELWKSNGTSAGTNILKDIHPGPSHSYPTSLTVLNGQLYFSANDGIHGEEMWTSDGTSAGTVLRVDLTGDSGGSDPQQFVQVGSRLYTTAVSESSGRELYVQGTDLLITPPGTGNHAVTIRRNGSMLEAVDSATSAVINSLEVAYAESITFNGLGAGNDTVTIDYTFGGFFSVAGGIHINDANFGSDGLIINGNGLVSATYLSSGANSLGQASLLIQQGSVSSTISFSNVENITLAGMLAVSTQGPVAIATSTLNIDSALPVNLSQLTTISGGTLTSTSPIALASGEAFLGAGNVNGRFAAESGSLISASGSLALGTAASANGFATRGELRVNQFNVTLNDANQAVLGELTTFGSGIVPGNLSAANGLLVDFGNNVTGYGMLTTTNSAAKPFINNGALVGTSPAQPLTLTGYIKGVGTFDNVNIVGTFSPGFSPAAITLGTMLYSPSSTTVIEIGGTAPGTGYDQLNHTGQATLGGTLELQLIGGFVPSLGNSFTFMTAVGGFVGSFSSINLPSLPIGLQWSLVTSATAMTANVVDANVAPSDILLSSSTMVENTAPGAAIGSLTTSDVNVGDTFVYTLASGTGDQDNGRFAIDSGGVLRNQVPFDFESVPSYSIRVRSTDQGGLFVERVFTISVIDAPELIGEPVFGDGTAQRSSIKQLVITLDGPVTILPNAFSVNKRGAGAVDLTASVVNNATQTIVTLNFSGIYTRGAGALVDGYYDLRIEGGRIVRGTQALDANKDGLGGDVFLRGTVETDNYFALYGDTNGDGLVGVAEFGQFRNAFGKTNVDAAYNPLFDYDADGVIGVADFGQFRNRFGKPKPVFS